MRLAMSHSLLKIFSLSTLSSYLGSYSSRFRALSYQSKSNQGLLSPCSFTIEKGEVFRISSTCQEIQVLSGVAWLTAAGKDIILSAGEKTSLLSNEDSVLLSALGNVPLTLEIL
jgi:hypothetical protein